MESVVTSSMEAARRGGVPGTLSLVASFVSLHVPVRSLGLEDCLIDNLPLWPMIYFCLRCGDYAAAASIERRSGAATDELSTALEELANSSADTSGRRLSTRTETQLRFHYRRHVRASTDPYKRIVYCALGKFLTFKIRQLHHFWTTSYFHKLNKACKKRGIQPVKEAFVE